MGYSMIDGSSEFNVHELWPPSRRRIRSVNAAAGIKGLFVQNLGIDCRRNDTKAWIGCRGNLQWIARSSHQCLMFLHVWPPSAIFIGQKSHVLSSQWTDHFTPNELSDESISSHFSMVCSSYTWFLIQLSVPKPVQPCLQFLFRSFSEGGKVAQIDTIHNRMCEWRASQWKVVKSILIDLVEQSEQEWIIFFAFIAFSVDVAKDDTRPILSSWLATLSLFMEFVGGDDQLSG